MIKSFLTIWGCSLLLSGPALAGGPFSPTDLDNLQLFFLSTDFGPNAIATCSTESCYQEINTEILDLSRMYCDTTPGAMPGAMGYAPDGCVRWWEDQGPFDCGTCGQAPHDDEWVRGHEHGQDDIAKPAYVPDCLNGQPCARLPTVAEMGPNAGQIACLELQNNDTVMVTGNFTVFLLVAPRDQAVDWWYFGNPNNGLRHNVVDDSLSFRTNATPEVLVTGPGAIDVSGGQWQLIEIHRVGGNYQVIVNGEDVTLPGAASNTALYEHRYLGAQNCNGITGGLVGDLAAFLLYNDRLLEGERASVRDYFESHYTLDLLFADDFESGDVLAWSRAIP